MWVALLPHEVSRTNTCSKLGPSFLAQTEDKCLHKIAYFEAICTTYQSQAIQKPLSLLSTHDTWLFLHCSSFSHLWEASDGIFYLHIYGSSIEFLNSNYFINYSTSIKSTQSQLWLFLANLHYSLLILFTFYVDFYSCFIWHPQLFFKLFQIHYLNLKPK